MAASLKWESLTLKQNKHGRPEAYIKWIVLIMTTIVSLLFYSVKSNAPKTKSLKSKNAWLQQPQNEKLKHTGYTICYYLLYVDKTTWTKTSFSEADTLIYTLPTFIRNKCNLILQLNKSFKLMFYMNCGEAHSLALAIREALNS